MAIEIERKFLLLSEEWRALATPHVIKQGYLSRDPDRIVRVRRMDDHGFLTIKGRSHGLARTEIEFPISAAEAEELLPLCLPHIIDKTRHTIPWGELIWEIDEFHGANAGLIVAEIELPTESTSFESPTWLGMEVTDQPCYSNSALSEKPFSQW